MKRRDLLKGGTLAFLGTALANPFDGFAREVLFKEKGKVAKNIIFMVSDGMSIGTLSLANLLLQRKEGRTSEWISLYEKNKVKRALMDTASANSMVTDSAAASSAWGGGKRVNNGSLNTNADGTENTPIWKKFKSAGKSAGCVTTVPITHATPAGFCVSTAGRGDQAGIALKYLTAGYDVLMGGGMEYFNSEMREDKEDVLNLYRQQGYQIALDKASLMNINNPGEKPLLGVFHLDGLPYTLDQSSDHSIEAKIPSLSEMTDQAIKHLNHNPKGFVLQVEAGKVDWAAHANDAGALIYDQLAFDAAIKVVLDFAERDKETLVIITTDHGNANPGLFSGAEADANFDRVQHFRHTNEWILKDVDSNTSSKALIDKIQYAQGYAISTQEAQAILGHYGKPDENGLYNPKKLPFKELAQLQTAYTSIGWAGTDHSADYVELAMLGPGSELLQPFVKNYHLHNLMLKASSIKS